MKSKTIETLRVKAQNLPLQKVKNAFVFMAAWMTMMILSLPVYAAGGDPKQIIISILDIIIGKVFPAVGIVITVVGAFKLFMAFRNDQPDAYSGAAKDIVIGIAVGTFSTLLWPSIKGIF